MKIKVIFIDIDGTLINSRQVIDKETKQSLLAFEKAGGKIVLASARPHIGMERYGAELKLEEYGGYYAAFNGGQIVNAATHETMDTLGLSHDDVQKIFDAVKQQEKETQEEQLRVLEDTYPFSGELSLDYAKAVHDVIDRTNLNIMAYKGETLIMMRHEMYAQAEALVNNMRISVREDFLDAVDFLPVKILISGSTWVIPKVYPLMREKLGAYYDVMMSSEYFIEITPKGVNKGNAVKIVSQLLNIPCEEMAAFGDSDNDVPMLQRVGTGIAMGNGSDSAKQTADFVTLSNDENGISHFLSERFDWSDLSD